MALIELNFMSEALGTATALNVVLPQRGYRDTDPERKCRTVMPLHGLADNYKSWCRMTNVERYASGRNVMIIMPEGGRSYYTDAKTGERYAEYLYEEVPAVCRAIFKQMSDRREDNFIAGLSMGGYGAFKGAFTYPERYAACACLSAHYYHTDLLAGEHESQFYKNIFGTPEQYLGSENDCEAMVKKALSAGKTPPEMYVACGKNDFLIEQSRRMHAFLGENGVAHVYSETEGVHDWSFWNYHIERVLDFFDEVAKRDKYSGGCE